MKKIFALLSTAMLAVLVSSCAKYNDGYYDEPYYESAVTCITLRSFSGDETVWFIPEKKYSETLPQTLTEWQKIAVYEVKAHSSYELTFDSGDSYITPIETYGVEDKMPIYVFKYKDWVQYEWSELVSGQMWVGKCVLSVEEMVALNHIVTYPMQQ